eukprot:Ihof_evm1s654 gene=Ihof_evmTU1s654
MATVEALQKRFDQYVEGAMATSMGYIGDVCGLFKAIVKIGPSTATTIAMTTGLNERYVLEWCKAATAMHFIEYDSKTDYYFMTDAQNELLAKEDSQVFKSPTFQLASTCIISMPQVIQKGFKEGTGVGPEVYGALGTYDAIGRMNASMFKHELVSKYFKGVLGLIDMLTNGVRVLDVGCGMGGSTIAMAKEFPKSHFIGVDCHMPSLNIARERTVAQGLANVTYECYPIEDYLKKDQDKFDAVLCFDTIHDMVDPVGTLRILRESLRDQNSIMVWSEPRGAVNPMNDRDSM